VITSFSENRIGIIVSGNVDAKKYDGEFRAAFGKNGKNPKPHENGSKAKRHSDFW
jgi:hypothetical protein